MHDTVIETSSLQKIYGQKVVVADLTLSVPRGEIFGFLGPNGAGKSTSVKMLLGLVRINQGQARVLGQPPGHPAAMARVGFLPEHFRFHEWLQAAEMLDLHGKLYGLDAATRRRRIPEVLELVGLSEHARRQLSGFSKGMLQRIGLAQALIHEPELVFLDEPTSALDPFGRRLVRQIIHDLKAQGTTVFLNSHLLGEVEATCDRVTFIKQGRVLQTLQLKDMPAEHVQVEMRASGITPALLSDLQALTSGSIQGTDALDAAANGCPVTLHLTLPDDEMLPAIAERTLASGARLYALTPRHISLEQRFIEIVGMQDSGQ
jgi:ABC-2 type transport system ATP-binding protein